MEQFINKLLLLAMVYYFIKFLWYSGLTVLYILYAGITLAWQRIVSLRLS